MSAVEFDEPTEVSMVPVDFKPATRIKVSGYEGQQPVHDTAVKTYRHPFIFKHECNLQLRTPRVKLPNGAVRLVEPDLVGRLLSFTLLFNALMLAQQIHGS